jgi:hypothetical protein
MMKYGFAEEAMMPVYGMAEATLAISFSPLMETHVITGFDAESSTGRELPLRLPPRPAPASTKHVSVGSP